MLLVSELTVLLPARNRFNSGWQFVILLTWMCSGFVAIMSALSGVNFDPRGGVSSKFYGRFLVIEILIANPTFLLAISWTFFLIIYETTKEKFSLQKGTVAVYRIVVSFTIKSVAGQVFCWIEKPVQRRLVPSWSLLLVLRSFLWHLLLNYCSLSALKRLLLRLFSC